MSLIKEALDKAQRGSGSSSDGESEAPAEKLHTPENSKESIGKSNQDSFGYKNELRTFYILTIIIIAISFLLGFELIYLMRTYL